MDKNSIRYKSGIYKILKESPIPEDIEYSMSSKKEFVDEDLVNIFGEDKIDIIELSLRKLVSQGKIKIEDSKYIFIK